MNCLDGISRLANMPVYVVNDDGLLVSTTCPLGFIEDCAEYHDYTVENIDFDRWGWVVYIDYADSGWNGVTFNDFLQVLDHSPLIEVRLHNVTKDYDIVSLHDCENLAPDMYEVICLDCAQDTFIVHVIRKDCK